MPVRFVVLGALLATAMPAAAQQQDQDPDQPYVYEEQVVVTASKAEQELVNAPAAVSLISSETIQNSPATNMGDLLRNVPGVNVTQVSARDINITSRGATSTLATSQLVLVDGRSIYLDFYGMVMWDLVPANPSDIRQIEVIRGPASAVWGANAMTGVVNVLTKSPREIAASGGSSLTIDFGGFDRKVGANDPGAGSLYSVNASHAQAVNDRVAFKVSAGYFSQDPMPRPTGVINNSFRTPYPAYENAGTSQPKFDARVDYELPDSARLTFSGGYTGTEGLIHSGIGPFDIESGTGMTYFSTRYGKGGRRIAFFTNMLNGNAPNLLAVGPTGQRIDLIFDTKTFDFEAGDVKTIASRHLLSYGGNYRHNTFDISLAPNGDDRNEGGGYIQDEIFLNDHFRWVIGGRLDKFSSIDGAVFSPRTTFMFKPAASQTIRASFNRAFRAPSFINNNIEQTIINQLNLGLINPALNGVLYNFPIRAVGNPDMKQETMTAYELGYTGVVRQRATVTAAVYWNTTDDAIFFTQVARYSAANPPPGWPLPPLVLEALAAAGSPLPSAFSYRNLGKVKDKGIELGVDTSVNRSLNVFTNYSYQWEPEAVGFPLSEINLPPNHRFNAGFNFSYRRFLGNMSVNYTDEAFWQDVLDARFSGVTDAYTLVNGAFGVRWAADRLTTSVKVTNLANEEVMQHIFGDVMKRTILGEVRLSF